MYIKRISIPIISFLLISFNTATIFAMKEFDAKQAAQFLTEYRYGDLQNMFYNTYLATKKSYKNVNIYETSTLWLENTVNETQDPFLSFEHTHRIIYQVWDTKNYELILNEFGPIIFNIIHIIAEHKAYKALFKRSSTHFSGISKNPVDIWVTSYIHRLVQNQKSIIGSFLPTLDVEKYIKFENVQKVFEKYYDENLESKIKNEKNFFRFIQTWDRLPIVSLFVDKIDSSYRPHLFNIDILDKKNIIHDMSASIVPNQNEKDLFSLKNSLILRTFSEDKVKGTCNRVMTATFKACKEYIMNAKSWSDLWTMHKKIGKIKVSLKEQKDEIDFEV